MSATALPGRSWDHPRVCGEHQVRDTLYGTTQGSSPRMRGTHRTHRDGAKRTGIIPAYAGNTCQPSDHVTRPRDHPRVCGEHTARHSRTPQDRGSSPRMRGTRVVVDAAHFTVGIIPAYAGNTCTSSRRTCGAWDHPRVCGEHVERAQFDGVAVGSSPRMRGTLTAYC